MQPRRRAMCDAVTGRVGASCASLFCDRFRLAELDRLPSGRVRPVVPRVARWSEASEDIRACRKAALDGPLSVAPESRPLLAASLAAAMVKTDDQGSVRLAKRGTNNCGRDDVAAGFVLACGALSRAPKPTGRRRSAIVG